MHSIYQVIREALKEIGYDDVAKGLDYRWLTFGTALGSFCSKFTFSELATLLLQLKNNLLTLPSLSMLLS